MNNERVIGRPVAADPSLNGRAEMRNIAKKGSVASSSRRRRPTSPAAPVEMKVDAVEIGQRIGSDVGRQLDGWHYLR